MHEDDPRVDRIPKSEHGDLPRKTSTGDVPCKPWELREAYFKTHGNHPSEPYITREPCGCYTIWETPAFGAAFKCQTCATRDDAEMEALQRRRYAFAGVPFPKR